MGTTLSVLGQHEHATTQNWADYTVAQNIAEAGTESGIVQLRALLVANPTPNKADLDAIMPPDGETTLATFTVYTITLQVSYDCVHYVDCELDATHPGEPGHENTYVIHAQVVRHGTKADSYQWFRHFKSTNGPDYSFYRGLWHN
jgi:hypothetical protein